MLRSGNELLSRAEVDDLWELAIGRIKVILIEQFSYITNPESFIRIKETIVLFCKTLDQYSLNTLPLTSFLANHRDKYEEILVQKFREEVTSIFFEEKYEPLTIKTSKDYDKLVNAYQLEIEFEDLDIEKHTTEEKSEIYVNEEAQVFETVFTEDIEDNLLSPISTKTDASHTGYVSDSENSTSFPRIKFPITVAFSITVPKICKLTKRFIHDYYVFARNLRTMDDAIRIAVETIFINEVNDHMNTILDKSTELNISQAVQIAINANQFTHVCTFFERYLSTFLNTRSLLDIEEVSIRLNSARNAFTRTASRAQDLIFELVNSKIEVFLTSLGGNTNWMPSRPNKHPSGIIQDLIAYLETTFMCLNFLPKHIRLGIHFTSCRHVSGIILRELLHTKKYNAIAMYNLGLDIQALEEFASRQNIPRLMDAFSEIRQIVDLILSGDIEQILDKPTRDSKFPFVSTEKLVTILEKFKELGILNVTVDGVPKIKKSTVLAVVKRLKS